MNKRILRSVLFLSLLASSAAPSLADTVNYEYDALGRLQRVEHSDGSAITYTLDPAGNRTQVTTTIPPNAPPSISVPLSSTTGSYTISWGAASGTVTAYKLYEATNSSFTGQTLVHDGTGTSKALSGRGNGTYYYRVTACNGSACSSYRSGANGIAVTLPPSAPSSISVPLSSSTGSYAISWGTASGTVTAYQLYEATNSSFSGQVQVYSGIGTSKAISGKGSGTYYYRVRACNGSACSGYRTGGNSVAVTLPPGVPSSISVPSSSSTGSYSISWGTASGTVTAYKLYESTNSSFSGQVQVYSGTGTSKAISGKGNGTYYYRVRACNGGGCSAYIAGGNPTVVSLPGVPPSITVPSSSNSGSYTISWGASSGSVTRYELYEATNASFSGQVRVYSGGSRSAAISGKDTGTYYYRVRACNASVCSAYRTGTNAITVSVPIQVLNPAIQVGCCTTTSITALADLNGNAGTIHSFSESCSKASVVIESGAQSVGWSNSNTFYRGCEIGVNQQCSASYVIRNSGTGQLHSGTSSIVVLAQGRTLPPTMNCP